MCREEVQSVSDDMLIDGKSDGAENRQVNCVLNEFNADYLKVYYGECFYLFVDSYKYMYRSR